MCMFSFVSFCFSFHSNCLRFSQYYFNINFSYNFPEQENLVSDWGGKGLGKKSSLIKTFTFGYKNIIILT